MSQPKKSDNDLEAQATGLTPLPTRNGAIDSEYTVSTWTKASYLAVYFLCNVSLTIYNKLVLGKVSTSRVPPPAEPHRSSLRLPGWLGQVLILTGGMPALSIVLVPMALDVSARRLGVAGLLLAAPEGPLHPHQAVGEARDHPGGLLCALYY